MKKYILAQSSLQTNHKPEIFNTREEAEAKMKYYFDDILSTNEFSTGEISANRAIIMHNDPSDLDDQYETFNIYEMEV